MIARTAHARNFSHLAVYLESDKEEPGRSRVAWWERYNVPDTTLQRAARRMERTAETNRMVDRPAYHLFVAVSPQDDATKPRMQAVAKGLLRRLGLEEHQAVAVGHDDRRHPHLHIVVNRVHPVSARAWDVTRDWPRIEAALRAMEVEMGFRPTPGRLAPTPDGRWCDDARAMPVGARRFELREMEKARVAAENGRRYAPRPSFLRSVREALSGPVLGASGWDEIAAAVAERGMLLVQTARGLVVTDGVHSAAMSRVASGASLHRLTRTFGEDYVGFVARSAAFAGDAPSPGHPASPTARAEDRFSAGGAGGPPVLPLGVSTRPPVGAGGASGARSAGVGGRGAATAPDAAGGRDRELAEGRGAAGTADRVSGDAPQGNGKPDVGGSSGDRGDAGRGRLDAHGRVERGNGGAALDGRNADRAPSGGGRGAGEGTRGEHPGSSEPHRGRTSRAGAVGRGVEAPLVPPRDYDRRRDGGDGAAGGAAALPVLGDAASGRGGVEPRDASAGDVPGGTPGGPAGDSPRGEVADHGGSAAGHRPFRLERVPGGWAVVHPTDRRRWVLARRRAAESAVAACNARTGSRLTTILGRLDRASADPSQRTLVARRAAEELLDAAAERCFTAPTHAVAVVRMHHRRGRSEAMRAALAAGAHAFGAPTTVYTEPDRPHAHADQLAAWDRFRQAAEVWLDVQHGVAWTAPLAFPERSPGSGALPGPPSAGPTPIPISPTAADQRTGRRGRDV